MTGRSILLAVVAFSLMLLSAGCSGAASVESWQRGVERYIASTGGGNPTVLRDVKLPDGRRGFAILGAPDRRESTDANAVLLGFQQLNGKPRFVYLVGVVEKYEVKDIRLATLATENGKHDWQVGKKDDAALKMYRAYNDRIWRERFPGRQSPPVEYTSFPQTADQFELRAADESIEAIHSASGARWELHF